MPHTCLTATLPLRHPSHAMGTYHSNPSRNTGKRPSPTVLNQTIESPAAVVTMNQDIVFMVCAEVRAHDFHPGSLLTLRQLYHSGTRPDLVSAAQTSTMWNIAATPWLYRSITLDFDKSKSVLTARLLKSFLKVDNQQPTYRHYVQNLKIKMPSIEGDSSRRRLKPGVLKTLARLVPLLSMLNSFMCVSSLAASYAPIFSNAITAGKFPSQCRNHCLRRFTITQSCPVNLLFSRVGVLMKNATTSKILGLRLIFQSLSLTSGHAVMSLQSYLRN